MENDSRPESSHIVDTEWVPAPKPKNEEKRLWQLKRYNILGTPNDKVIDDIREHTRKIFNSNAVAVTLIGKNTLYLKSKYGLSIDECNREDSICNYAILNDASEVLVILDVLQDKIFKHAPYVLNAPHIRFYAGAPLRSVDGSNLGTLCILDTNPRKEFSSKDQETLQFLAREVIRRFNETMLEIDNKRIKDIHELVESLYDLDNDKDTILEVLEKTKIHLNVSTVAFVEISNSDFKIIMYSGQKINVDRRQFKIGISFFTDNGSAIALKIKKPISLQNNKNENKVLQFLLIFSIDENRVFDELDIDCLERIADILSRKMNTVKQKKILDNHDSMVMKTLNHQIRTPLFGAYGMVELLEAENETETENSSMLHVVHSCLKSLHMITDNLLDYQQYVHDSVFVLKNDKIDFHEFISNTMDIFQSLCPVYVELLCETPLIGYTYVYFDKAKITSILCNMLSNAIKFTHSGSITVQYNVTDKNIEIRVTDTGIGMSENFVNDKLFSQFSKEDFHSIGMGLGLHICKILSKKMNGDINLVSTKLKVGSVFKLEIPISKANITDYQTKFIDSTFTKREFQIQNLGNVTLSILAINRDLDYMTEKFGISDNIIISSSFDYAKESVAKISDKEKTVFLVLVDFSFIISEQDMPKNCHLVRKPATRLKLFEFLQKLYPDKVVDPFKIVRKSDFSKVRALIVDDNRTNRDIFSMFLKKLKVQYLTAVDGREGLEKYQNSNIDIVLLDLDMPVMNGFDCLTAIRDFEEIQQIEKSKIYILTASASDVEQKTTFDLGGNGFYTKPVTYKSLTSIFEKHWGTIQNE